MGREYRPSGENARHSRSTFPAEAYLARRKIDRGDRPARLASWRARRRCCIPANDAARHPEDLRRERGGAARFCAPPFRCAGPGGRADAGCPGGRSQAVFLRQRGQRRRRPAPRRRVRQPFQADAQAAAGAGVDHRYVGSDQHRQRLRLRSGLRHCRSRRWGSRATSPSPSPPAATRRTSCARWRRAGSSASSPWA